MRDFMVGNIAAGDMTGLDVSAMADTALGVQATLDERTTTAVAGWMFVLSDQYSTWKSDRPRDGEAWDMDGGRAPVDVATS